MSANGQAHVHHPVAVTTAESETPLFWMCDACDERWAQKPETEDLRDGKIFVEELTVVDGSDVITYLGVTVDEDGFNFEASKIRLGARSSGKAMAARIKQLLGDIDDE